MRRCVHSWCMGLCMCVCVFMCVHVCVYVCSCVHMYACMCVHVCTCMRVCVFMYACMCVHVCSCMQALNYRAITYKFLPPKKQIQAVHLAGQGLAGRHGVCRVAGGQSTDTGHWSQDETQGSTPTRPLRSQGPAQGTSPWGRRS